LHLEALAEVGAGRRLAPGDVVGRVGCTGSCYGPHLHFEIRDGSDPYGTARDPLPELQRWTRVP
jgi:murein DD-endopeptidase MepM/ murein hydrolase activator NlpD